MPAQPDQTDRDGPRREAFPKALRILRRAEYRQIQDHGRKIHTAHLLLFSAPCDGDQPRLGIVATKKVGNAVVRNRLKRRVREVWRRHRGEFPRGRALVVLIKRDAQDLDSATMAAELLRASKRC
jgi:ribonuclease P protein component